MVERMTQTNRMPKGSDQLRPSRRRMTRTPGSKNWETTDLPGGFRERALMLMKRKAGPDADSLHPSEKPDQTMVDSGPESHPPAPSSASPVKTGSPISQHQ